VFLRTYSCVKRQWKGALSGFISVLAADYALFVGAYQLAILAAGFFQRRQRHGLSLFLMQLICSELL
jgi:hypothetical protein